MFVQCLSSKPTMELHVVHHQNAQAVAHDPDLCDFDPKGRTDSTWGPDKMLPSQSCTKALSTRLTNNQVHPHVMPY